MKSHDNTLIFLNRVYESIRKYIFSERTIHSRLFGLYFIDFNANMKCPDRFKQGMVSDSDFSDTKNLVKIFKVFYVVYLKRRPTFLNIFLREIDDYCFYLYN